MKKFTAPANSHAHVVFALALALGALVSPVHGHGQTQGLSGDWVLNVESPNGTGQRQMTLVQDGGVISGEISSSRASGELQGTIDGDTLTFVAVVQMDSGAFEITYTATVTGDEMKGTVDFGDYGQGTFTGRRVEDSAPSGR